MSDFLIPLSTVEERLGVKRTTIYKLIRAGGFPPPIKIGSASRWAESKIDAWVEKQMASAESGDDA